MFNVHFYNGSKICMKIKKNCDNNPNVFEPVFLIYDILNAWNI